MTPNYAELFCALLPEAELTLTALLVLGYDLVAGRKRTDIHRLRVAVAIGLVGLVGAAFASFESGVDGPAFGGIVTLDSRSNVSADLGGKSVVVASYPRITWAERLGGMLLIAAMVYIGLKPDVLLEWITPALQSPLMQAALKGGAP